MEREIKHVIKLLRISLERCAYEKIEPHHGKSIVLHFAEVDVSIDGEVSTDSLEVLCRGRRVCCSALLLEIPAKSSTVQRVITNDIFR